ncbi:MAG: YebB family permuted papain-like enzyme [Rhizobacter sp.]
MIRLFRFLIATLLAASVVPHAAAATSVSDLGPTLRVGDVVFIRVTARPFREVATATGSWTNHVGIVVDTSGREPVIAESTLPVSGTTGFSRFVGRSEDGRVSIARPRDLSADEQRGVRAAAARRDGVRYDTGFDLHSRGQFCSRFVREVLREATGIEAGDVETFDALLKARPETDLSFWKVWFLGSIPWQRETVTPASLLRSPALTVVFDGTAAL